MKNPINIKAIPKFLFCMFIDVTIISFLLETLRLIQQNKPMTDVSIATACGCAFLMLFFTFKIMGKPLKEITKKEE